MPQVVPDAIELEVINSVLAPDMTIRIYGNDVTPAHDSTVGAFVEITGGGYANKPITFANWTITAGEPTSAKYSSQQRWVFTGPISGTGNIFGYFVTRNSDGKLMWAERFQLVPFTPIDGSIVAVTPAFSVESQF
jgi:hypothetical protein